MNTQDTANDILVDLHSEGQRNLLCDSRAPPAGIASFHFHDGVDQFLFGSLRTGLVPTSGGKQHTVLSFGQHVVEMQQSGRLQNDGRAEKASPAHEQGTQTGDDTIFGPQVGRALSAAIKDAQLMFDEHRFRNDRPEATRSCQSGQGDDQMNENDDNIAHPRILSEPPKPTEFGPIW
jgi:hypothetical protein